MLFRSTTDRSRPETRIARLGGNRAMQGREPARGEVQAGDESTVWGHVHKEGGSLVIVNSVTRFIPLPPDGGKPRPTACNRPETAWRVSATDPRHPSRGNDTPSKTSGVIVVASAASVARSQPSGGAGNTTYRKSAEASCTRIGRA